MAMPSKQSVAVRVKPVEAGETVLAPGGQPLVQAGQARSKLAKRDPRAMCRPVQAMVLTYDRLELIEVAPKLAERHRMEQEAERRQAARMEAVARVVSQLRDNVLFPGD
jgi:hypothetical protein